MKLLPAALLVAVVCAAASFMLTTAVSAALTVPRSGCAHENDIHATMLQTRAAVSCLVNCVRRADGLPAYRQDVQIQAAASVRVVNLPGRVSIT
jgi:hypothetical protein